MTDDRSHTDWARRHVEAAAAGDLEPDDRLRFDEAMRADPEIESAFERAKQLRQALRQARPERAPTRLLLRLLGIPGRQTDERAARTPWQRAAGPVAAVATLLVVALIAFPPSPPAPDTNEAAVQDFLIAMTYLQRSTAIAHSKVRGEVGSGFLEAVTVSRDSLLGETTDSTIENGG